MTDFNELQPIGEFCQERSTQFGNQARSLKTLIDRNASELIDKGILFKTKGRSRLVHPTKFMQWYLNH